MQATGVATVLFVTSVFFWPRAEQATEPERSLFAGPLQIISTTEAQAGPVAVDLTAFDELMGGMSELTATARAAARPRSEERRVGKEGVRTGRSRWAPYHKKKKK